jgi:phenol 2-monooxygenase
MVSNGLKLGRVEDYLLGYIQKWSDLEVQRGVMPESLSIDNTKIQSDDEYPVSVTLQHLSEDGAKFKINGETHGSSTPNGLFRSNLTADDTTALLDKARSNANLRSEKIMAKYVVGCDGAHSWTRRQIGSVTVGEQTDYIW